MFISKYDLLQDITHEINIIKHLSTKIIPNTHEFKPTEKQRTMMELMHYLSYIGQALAVMLETGSFNHFKELSEKAVLETNLDNFILKMDEQIVIIKEIFEKTLDEEREKEIPFFDGSVMKKKNLAMFLLKNLVAYRMQFFLYIKQAGNETINTRNAWTGKDPE